MKRRALLITLAVLFGATITTTNTFAANPYGIVYSGGENLGAGNVQINPGLIDGLTPLLQYSATNKVTFSDSNKWEEGYIKTSVCWKTKYLTVSKSQLMNESSNISYRVSKNQYTADVRFNGIAIDGLADGAGSVAIPIHPAAGTVYAGVQIYLDSDCEIPVGGIKTMTPADGINVFLDLNIKLYKNGQRMVSDEMYFSITDIDGAQSYKILNTGNELSLSNMYAKSAEVLQPQDPSITLRNKYVANGNYIYSQYDDNGSFDISETDANSDIYVKLNAKTQEDGLNIVFGYAGRAGSGIQYYAKQYHVTYVSDDNGTITGLGEEDVFSGDNPSGSSSTPNDDFEFKYWTADTDVTLDDGTVIKSGQTLTGEQIKRVVVDRDIVFTAVHEGVSTIAAPDTGTATKNANAVAVVVPIAGLIVGALLVGLLPRLLHKKIDFTK